MEALDITRVRAGGAHTLYRPPHYFRLPFIDKGLLVRPTRTGLCKQNYGTRTRKGVSTWVKRRDSNGIKAFLSELQPHNPIMFGTVTWQPLGP